MDDDAFFLVEHVEVLSQFFMAVSPKHPLMYLAVQATLLRLLEVVHVGKQYIPLVTGPGALKQAFIYFMRSQKTEKYAKVSHGKYYGVANRSVTVAGSKETSWQYLIRNSVLEKGEGYKLMKMKHYSKIAKLKFNESCLVHMYNLDFFPGEQNMTNW